MSAVNNGACTWRVQNNNVYFNQIQIRRLFGIFNKILEIFSGTRAVI